MKKEYTHEVIQKAKELQKAMKEFDYVEDVQIDMQIFDNRNFVDTIEKATHIVDSICGSHRTRVVEDFVVVDNGDMNRDKDGKIEITIYLPGSEHNMDIAMDENFKDVVKEEKIKV